MGFGAGEGLEEGTAWGYEWGRGWRRAQLGVMSGGGVRGGHSMGL
jgi:hypothetical protein